MARAASIGELRSRRLIRELSLGRKPRLRRVPPRPKDPRGARLAYTRALLDVVHETVEAIRETVLTQLERITTEVSITRPEPEPVRLDAPAAEIERVIDEVRIIVGRRITPARVRDIAETQAHQLNLFNREDVSRQILSTVGIDLGADPFIAQHLETFIADNAKLITSIPENLLKDVEGIIGRGARRGLRHEALARDIQARFEVTESRAKLIARDQIASLNGELTQLRHQSLGVTRYVWLTSRDERVRPEHEDRDGEIFSWDSPPEDGHPGQPINCRCTAQPVVDDLLAGL